MNILVINTGSSSLKYQLLDSESRAKLAGGVIERIGEAMGALSHTVFNGGPPEKTKQEQPIPDHQAAMQLMAGLLTQPIDAVGHRVVQGGESFKQATLITPDVKAAIEANNDLAPLHNPANLTGIKAAEKLFPGKPQVAVFDTNFHQTIPEKAYLYALPYPFYTDHKVRKYGFHGTSHKFVATRTAELMGKPADEVNLITLHLGNGCSLCAVEKGKCKDTSMGMTPLAGIMMGTRSGDLDPAIFDYLMEKTGMDRRDLNRVLNKESGFKGICGHNDLRDVLSRAAEGDHLADLAMDMFTYQIKKVVGAYAAVLGKVDALAFTAGVGENAVEVRARALENLSVFGIALDPQKNAVRSKDPRPIHSDDSRVQVWVVPTNEELQIAVETRELLLK